MRRPRDIIKLNVPTILTLSRIVVIPLMIYITPTNNFLGAMIFSFAAITDFLDGYLARRSGDVTNFGILIDPIADKFLVIAALIILVDMTRVSVLVAVIIIVREVLVTTLRMVALGKEIVIAAEMGGKLKTGAQITAIICLMLAGPDAGPMQVIVDFLSSIYLDLYDVGTVALWISVVLAVVSGVQYNVMFWKKWKDA